MAFPDIPTVAGGRILFTLNTAGGATKTFPNLSSLTKNAGDLLIAICVEYDGNSTNAEFSSWGGGFTEIADRSGTATMAIGVAYKFSTGSESGTFTVTTADTSTNDSVMILLSISGAHASQVPEVSAMTTGTSAAADIASLTVSWGAEDNLWILVHGVGETSTTGSFTGISAIPSGTGYAESGITADVVGGVEAAVAFMQENTATQDPAGATVDTSNARNAALQIGIRPAPAADPPNEGSATGSITWAGTATGTRVSSGAASGSIAWVGSSTGARVSQGAGSGSVVWSGTAEGEAPVVVQDGFATGTITWSGSATGARPSAGSAAGAITWVGTAFGARVSAGVAAGSIAWTGTATGSRTSSGAATGNIAWTGSATGESPTPGVQEGSAEGAISWVGTATGARPSAGAAFGNITWAGSASGTRTSLGSVIGTITWTGAATGMVPLQGPRWVKMSVGTASGGGGYQKNPVGFTRD